VAREIVATFCRDAHACCPAFRYLRATGSPAHPADFRSWVVRDIPPGQCDSVAKRDFEHGPGVE
jgi:hypothetical protein